MFPYGIYGYPVDVPVTVPEKEIKCDACNELVDPDGSYMVMAGFRSHMIEECMTVVYEKVKETNAGFELAVRG